MSKGIKSGLITKVVEGIAIVAMVAGAPAFAAHVQFGKVVAGGTACAGGEGVWLRQQSGSRLQYSFDHYVAHASASSAAALDRATCDLAIPVSLPRGYALVVTGFGLYGNSEVYAPDARVKVAAQLFEAGSTGLSAVEELQDRAGVLLSDQDLRQGLLVTECGANTTLRLNTDARAIVKGWGEAKVSVESLALETKLVRCR